MGFADRLLAELRNPTATCIRVVVRGATHGSRHRDLTYVEYWDPGATRDGWPPHPQLDYMLDTYQGTA